MQIEKSEEFISRYLGVSIGEIPREDFDDLSEQVELSAIPLNYEKFISFNIGELRFIGSVQFMGSSLDKLIGNLYDKEDKYKNFNFIKREIPNNYELVCQKGYYPYEWVDGLDKLNYKGLPPREAFYSRLKQEAITQEEYEHALYVYEKLRCQSFLDCHFFCFTRCLTTS